MAATGAAVQRKKESRRPSRRNSRNAPHLFERWKEVSRRLRAAKEIRLFMDFDGTLAPHSPYLDSVTLSDEMKAALGRIAAHRRVHVGIMSGRRRATLQRLMRIPHVEFYGLYGSENGNGLDISILTALHLRQVLDAMAEHSAAMRGIEVEDKGASVAIHFRNAPNVSRRAAARLIRSAVSDSHGDLHIMETDTAWDVVPSEVQGKGAAIRRVLQDTTHSFLPIYVGDDISDEPAFEELRRGITIRVGTARRTEAHFRLRDPEEVLEFLNRLEKELP
jgi:trehalose 6-phosphate phosphatase